MAKRPRDEDDTTTATNEDEPSQFPEMAHTPKYTSVEPEQKDDNTRHPFSCDLPPHNPLIFSKYSDFESHYNTHHTNQCLDCTKNFPSEHLLTLHISETHDPLLAARRERGEKTFACFVEGCDKVCADWKKRRSHLVDKHGFPRNYDFFIVKDGIRGRWNLLRKGVDENGHWKSSRERLRRESTTTQTTEGTEASVATDSVVEDGADVDGEGAGEKSSTSKPPPATSKEVSMDEVTNSLASLQFVPRSITFGKRKGKSGFAKQ